MGVLTTFNGLEPNSEVPTKAQLDSWDENESLSLNSNIQGEPPVLGYPDDRLLSILMLQVLVGIDDFDLIQGAEHVGGVDSAAEGDDDAVLDGVERVFLSVEAVRAFSQKYADADLFEAVPVSEKPVQHRPAPPKSEPAPQGLLGVLSRLFGSKPEPAPEVEPEVETEDENRDLRDLFGKVATFLKTASDQSRPVLITIIV